MIVEISDRWKIAGLWVAVASVLLGSSTWATFQTWPDSLDRIWTPSHAAPAVSPLATPGSSSGADEHTQAAAMASLLGPVAVLPPAASAFEPVRFSQRLDRTTAVAPEQIVVPDSPPPRS